MELQEIAKSRKINVKDPFAEFLKASIEESDFEISLLDCYRFSGHACQSITGAYLLTEKAIIELFPNDHVCVRGDVKVSFGTSVDEKATGPRANVIGYITGAWGQTGFAGLCGEFSRKNLVTFNDPSIAENEIKFTRISTNKSVILVYEPQNILSSFSHDKEFPESWRVEVTELLKKSDAVVSKKVESENDFGSCSSSGCC